MLVETFSIDNFPLKFQNKAHRQTERSQFHYCAEFQRKQVGTIYLVIAGSNT